MRTWSKLKRSSPLRCAIGPDEAFADERQEVRPRERFGLGRERARAASGEVAPDHRRALDHGAFVAAQAFQALAQQGVDRRRDRESRAGVAFRQHRGHLLDEEGVALGGGADPLADVFASPPLTGSSSVASLDPRGRAARARARRARVGRDQRGARARRARDGQADEQDRSIAAPAEQVLDEVEQRRLGPVEVLEADDERAPSRARPRSARRTAQNASSLEPVAFRGCR